MAPHEPLVRATEHDLCCPAGIIRTDGACIDRAPCASRGAFRDTSTPGITPATAWFASRSWTPFPFQQETWRAYISGQSGLIHAPTGVGKSLAAWMGPIMECLAERNPNGQSAVCNGTQAKGGTRRTNGRDARSTADSRSTSDPLTVLWITPLRALAADTAKSLLEPVRDLKLPWSIETRTGDTTQSIRRKQRDKLPTALITTPESLSVLLSYPDCRERLSTLKAVVVDEWHELLGTKRGTQAELGLARLRAWNPNLRVWGLSATLGNLDQAKAVLMGNAERDAAACLVHGALPKGIEITTLLPDDIERFPWAGHLGTKLLAGVVEAVDRAATTLLFTNTRSQAENWFRSLLQARPDWMGQIAIHHGSIDRDIRSRVEVMLKGGSAKCVVCTSSLDLGVDFSTVEQVIQVGSPKGVARLMQRAGRSGHAPGQVSRVLCVPTHAFETMEFAAARDAANARRIEGREPLEKPLDVLVQHLVTIAAGGGFEEPEMLAEVRASWAFRNLTDEEWGWSMDFVRRGGPALRAYPRYARVVPIVEREEPCHRPCSEGRCSPDPTPDTQHPTPVPKWTVASDKLAALHRMTIGTITSDTSMFVKYLSGKTLGTIEESFIGKLREGDRFVFAGRTLELARVHDMTALVRRTKKKGGIVPTWNGGKMPLSSQLSEAVRAKVEEARQGRYDSPEMLSIKPLMELQRRWSILPEPGQLLVERIKTRDGHHIFLFPFEGRLVHEGLAALCAYRVSRLCPASVQATATDYGFDLHSPEALPIDERDLNRILSPDNLLEDLLACLNATQMARRRFRDIARVSGLILQGYPGAKKPARQLQASSELFFDVFQQFDPDNMLLTQAKREVLEEQLDIKRMRRTLDRISALDIVVVEPMRLTPLAFPVWAEVLRSNRVSSESWSQQISRMSVRLEEEADKQAAASLKPEKKRSAQRPRR